MAQNDEIPDYAPMKRQHLENLKKARKVFTDREKKLVAARDKLLSLKNEAGKINSDLRRADSGMKTARTTLTSHATAAKTHVKAAQRSLMSMDVAGFISAIEALGEIQAAFAEAVKEAQELDAGHDIITEDQLRKLKTISIPRI